MRFREVVGAEGVGVVGRGVTRLRFTGGVAGAGKMGSSSESGSAHRDLAAILS